MGSNNFPKIKFRIFLTWRSVLVISVIVPRWWYHLRICTLGQFVIFHDITGYRRCRFLQIICIYMKFWWSCAIGNYKRFRIIRISGTLALRMTVLESSMAAPDFSWLSKRSFPLVNVLWTFLGFKYLAEIESPKSPKLIQITEIINFRLPFPPTTILIHHYKIVISFNDEMLILANP